MKEAKHGFEAIEEWCNAIEKVLEHEIPKLVDRCEQLTKEIQDMAERADTEFANLDMMAKAKASASMASNVSEAKKIPNMVTESKNKITQQIKDL